MSVDVEASIIVGLWLPEELWDIQYEECAQDLFGKCLFWGGYPDNDDGMIVGKQLYRVKDDENAVRLSEDIICEGSARMLFEQDVLPMIEATGYEPLIDYIKNHMDDVGRYLLVRWC